MRKIALLAVAATLVACYQAKPPHSEELQKLRDADQAARRTSPPDLSGDAARRLRVLELVATGRVLSGLDHCNAALVLQHGKLPDDYLLAHELAVGALAQGHLDCRWLAAATEDRFLNSIDLKQRFGTQFRCIEGERRCVPHEISNGVPDTLRIVMGAPVLADTAKRGQELTAQLYPVTTGSGAQPATTRPSP